LVNAVIIASIADFAVLCMSALRHGAQTNHFLAPLR
jgi:hypothetical protein